jgi:dimethylglycine dehydrogenase
MALVDAEHVNDNLEVEIEILGELRSARRITVPLFDPGGHRMRG